ncbi:hypothetical protein IMCC21906_00849 [Spongiibacter sp. IMCC21906]|uniref:hypothetical protein n=1 Tax=Spongiibacter sp. IMCC21906 TaxID=1620392 RepID=UPI00062DE36F|nr:hypothetical protein [Spongiibacter sp. IMCC21906]AKH68540.1 hypothetical protein IMCC21906_00849 [Spongiibacter sp. IMCC21906]
MQVSFPDNKNQRQATDLKENKNTTSFTFMFIHIFQACADTLQDQSTLFIVDLSKKNG